MIYRGPGFLAFVWFGFSPPLSHQQVVTLSQSYCMSPVEHSNGRGGGGGGGKSYDRDKAWPSINFQYSLKLNASQWSRNIRLRRSEVTSRMHLQLFLSPNSIITYFIMCYLGPVHSAKWFETCSAKQALLRSSTCWGRI